MALLPQNQRDQGMVLLALLGVVAIVGYWTYYLEPKKVELAAVEEHIVQLQDMNQSAKAELARGTPEKLRQEAIAYRENLEVMRQLVPTSNEVPALLEQVSTAARRVGLDVGAVEPVPVIPGDQFDTYRYRISVRGDYHALGAFLANVGSLTRIVAPVNVQLLPDKPVAANAAAAPRPGERQLLESRFEIQTYVARTSPAPQPAAATPAATSEENAP